MGLYSREPSFESVLNFRDLGGYQAANGKTVSWRKVFRSGELRHASAQDLERLNIELGIRSILDLRNEAEVARYGNGVLQNGPFDYHNIPLIPDPDNKAITLDSLRGLSHNGQAYGRFLRFPFYGESVVRCLDLIADPVSLPIVFHCSAGKDRTGVLAAALLSVLGVNDDDIVMDYAMTSPHMPAHLARLSQDQDSAKFLADLPSYMHDSTPESMHAFLTDIKHDFGSFRGYLTRHGAEESLFDTLMGKLLT